MKNDPYRFFAFLLLLALPLFFSNCSEDTQKKAKELRRSMEKDLERTSKSVQKTTKELSKKGKKLEKNLEKGTKKSLKEAGKLKDTVGKNLGLSL